MFEKLEILQMAQAMASHAGLRQNAVSQNIANADTPGYKARDVASFADTYQSTDGSTALRTTRSGHIGGSNVYNASVTVDSSPGTTSPNGNSVSLEDQMVKGVEVRREHDLALAVYKTSMTILRTSLGK
ncbi:FlgB family protein [Phaeovulum sp. W22_SRMD_FR3]|uniref:FlgB family protein n=1 Tax=Phaeovulum sp. W22_SRMD_FR3 TaxID=3240274 RepID=UPI003F960E72